MPVTKRRAEGIWMDNLGCWELRVLKDGTRKRFRSYTAGRKGKREVETKADEWLESGADPTGFKSAWDTYLADIKETKSTSAYTSTEMLGRLYIVPNIGKLQLDRVTPARWQSCIDAAAAAGLSRRSCQNVRAQITAFLKYCRLHRWQYDRLEDGDLTIPRSATPAKQKHALSDVQLRTVFTDSTIVHYGKHHTAHYIYAFRFLILTGLRRGELCGLRHEDISGSILTINRSINTYKEETTGKTDNARRSFELTPMMQKVLADQRAYLTSMGIQSPWLFPDTYGERPDPNQLYDHWRTYCTQHDMKCSLHELRHTFISLTKSDLPMELLKSHVGHSTAMDTALIYGHEVTGDQSRAAGIIESVFLKHLTRPHTLSHSIPHHKRPHSRKRLVT